MVSSFSQPRFFIASLDLSHLMVIQTSSGKGGAGERGKGGAAEKMYNMCSRKCFLYMKCFQSC